MRADVGFTHEVRRSGGPGARRRPVDGLAVAALVLGVTSLVAPVLVPVAVGLGVAGLVVASRPGGRGEGHAAAAIVLAGAAVLAASLASVAAAAVATAASGPAADALRALGGPDAGDGRGGGDRARDGAGDGPRTAVIASVLEGHCLLSLSADGPVTTAEVVGCASPHVYEVFAVLPDDGSGGVYPGDEGERRLAGTACRGRLETNASQQDEDPRRFGVALLYPTPSGWALGDRTIYCLAVAADGQDLTGGPFLTDREPPLPEGTRGPDVVQVGDGV